MSEEFKVELSSTQREMLLRGLRFVRSSLMLNPQDPTDDSVATRKAELENIGQLVDQLNAAPSASNVG